MKRDMWQGGAYMFGSSYSEWSSAGIVAVDDYFRDENSWSVQNGYRETNMNAFCHVHFMMIRTANAKLAICRMRPICV